MNVPRMFGGGGFNFTSAPPKPAAGSQQSGAGDDEPEVPEGEEDDFQVFDEIFANPEEDDEELDANGEPKKTPPTQTLPTQQSQQPTQTEADKKMASEIQALIAGIGVGEKDIPADFDPNNPQQLRDLLGKTQQKTAMIIMQATLKPVQAAMESMLGEIRTEIRTMFDEGMGQDKRQQRLESIVPEAKDPRFKDIVQVVYKQSLKSLKSEDKALAATRKAITAMGLKTDKGQESNPSQVGLREGKSALDMYAPLPQRK